MIGQPKLSDDDIRLIGQLKAERERLYAEYRALSNERLAEKFEVSEVSVSRVEVIRD